MAKVKIKNSVKDQPDQYMEVSKTGVVSFQPEKPGNARQEFEIVSSGQ